LNVLNLSNVESISNNEITIGWIDNGTTEGKFTRGLVDVLITCPLPLQHYLHVQGSVIATNRKMLLDIWTNQCYSDWLLWVDSDIVLNAEAILKIRESAHPVDRPIVSGTYFLLHQQDGFEPFAEPALYTSSDEGDHLYNSLKDMPQDSLIKIDSAGFGFVLMHRNAIVRMINHHGDIDFFEKKPNQKNHSAEDFSFFANVKEAGIQLYGHTGAIVDHIKKIPVNASYYRSKK
jgi:hypothetical protein